MKRITKLFAVAMTTVSMLCVASCGKDDNDVVTPTPQAEPEVLTTLVGTGWTGSCNSVIVDPVMGALPTVITWTLDFLDDKSGEAYMEWTVAGMAQEPYTFEFSYSYDGATHTGTFQLSDDDAVKDFTVDIFTRTMKLDIGFYTASEQASEEDAVYVGGMTTFNQVR